MRAKRILALLLAFSLLAGSGCAGPDPVRDPEGPDDRYRAWYEVFVRSYADSDGDGIGDLRGLTEKLDYIRDLGCGGLWLMPVMPSPSYHKYDVTDYCAVDPEYGTMEDFRALVREAHARGIRVILDLPVNHTSDQHPWFLSAAGGPDAPCRNYYNWSDHGDWGYTERNGAWYESRFVDTMPDLNLDEPAVRQEIASVLRFWLEDAGADGFRLDAVTSYYTGDAQRNIDFLNWMADTAHGIDPDCYLVGEAWDRLPVIAAYAESRTDSFFLFPVSQRDGWIARVLALWNSSPGGAPGAMLGEYLLEMQKALPSSTVPAPFLENHDTDRIAEFSGRDDPARTKMAGGLLCLMPGSIFLYYGQEIGMTGRGNDPNRRIGMLWTAPEEAVPPPPGADEPDYAYPSVRDQEKDRDSILHYYQAALAIRARFPAIARGTTELLPCDNGSLCLALRTWRDQRILLAVNPSRETVRYRLAGPAGEFSVLAASLTAGRGSVKLRGRTVVLPAYSFAVLTP